MSRLITGTRPGMRSEAAARAGRALLAEIEELDKLKACLFLLGWTNTEVAKAMAEAHRCSEETGGTSTFVQELQAIVEQANAGGRPWK